MEIGFIGLGNLGTVLVQNLIEKERKLHIYNRTAEKMKAFEGKASLHNSIPSIAKACDVIISIVSDDKAVEAISFGENSLIQNLNPSSTHICLSTIAPATSSKLFEAHKAQGLKYLTATIIGRPEAAQARALTVCLSGTSQKKNDIIEILKDFGGKNIYEFGDDPKNAATVKICNNFLILSAIEAMGEAFQLVEKGGADKEEFYRMITETIFSAPVYKNYGKIINEKTYDKAGFTSQLGLKDIRLASSLADSVNMPMPFADLLKNRFLINNNRGRAQWDWTSIVKVIEEENKP